MSLRFSNLEKEKPVLNVNKQWVLRKLLILMARRWRRFSIYLIHVSLEGNLVQKKLLDFIIEIQKRTSTPKL